MTVGRDIDGHEAAWRAAHDHVIVPTTPKRCFRPIGKGNNRYCGRQRGHDGKCRFVRPPLPKTESPHEREIFRLEREAWDVLRRHEEKHGCACYRDTDDENFELIVGTSRLCPIKIALQRTWIRFNSAMAAGSAMDGLRILARDP